MKKPFYIYIFTIGLFLLACQDEIQAQDKIHLKDGAEVIVSGQYIDGVFFADELQTKCASRYEGDLRNENNYKLTELGQ